MIILIALPKSSILKIDSISTAPYVNHMSSYVVSLPPTCVFGGRGGEGVVYLTIPSIRDSEAD